MNEIIDFYELLDLKSRGYNMPLEDIQIEIRKKKKKMRTSANTASNPEKRRDLEKKCEDLDLASKIFESELSRREYDRKLKQHYQGYKNDAWDDQQETRSDDRKSKPHHGASNLASVFKILKKNPIVSSVAIIALSAGLYSFWGSDNATEMVKTVKSSEPIVQAPIPPATPAKPARDSSATPSQTAPAKPVYNNATSTPQAVDGYITGSNVVFRDTPRGNKKSLLQVNDKVKILGYQIVDGDHWCKATVNGDTGWVHRDFVSDTPAAVKAATTVPTASSSLSGKNQATTNGTDKKRQAAQAVSEGKKYWQQQKWMQAYEMFDKAYALNPTQDTKNLRENALANVKAEKHSLEQKIEREKIEVAKREQAEQQRRIQVQKEAEELARVERERQKKAKQEEEALKLLIGIGSAILNKQ